jgi:TolA-binding protein
MAGGMPDPMAGLDEEEPEEEEDVIDVDDLTDAQEEVNDKVNSVGRDLGKVDARIEKLIGAIETLQGMFDKNNQEIADLKTEFERRNPTQTEKLNLRSLDSYPFKVRPTDYWRDKAENGNYSAYADNEEPTTQEYVITNDDVDDFNEREIADSFAITDELDQNIKKIFGL